jgi:hypothetical protein
MPMTSIVDVVNRGEVLVSPVEITEALTIMGLTVNDLHGAIDAGETDRDSCNQFNPPTDAGNRAHGTVVRVLREIKVPQGWTFSDHHLFSTIVSPDRTLEVAVSSGDEGTGNSKCDPRSQYKKGERINIGVQQNRGQLLLFQSQAVTRMDRSTAPTIWILLCHRWENIVRCELSIPTSLGRDNRVNFEGTRIILPELNLGPRGGGIRSRDNEPSDTKIDVTVLRRQA